MNLATYDYVKASRDLRRQGERKGPDWLLIGVSAAFFALCVVIYLREMTYEYTDFVVHAGMAKAFDFADPHTITERLAYPLWHLFVSAFYQLGLPIGWAAALVTALAKLLTLLVVHRLMTLMLDGASRAVVTLTSLLLVTVTGLRLPLVTQNVYWGWYANGVTTFIGSPNLWHNPTQTVVLLTALLCVPYTLHCWYEFERRLPEKGERAMIPWSKVVTLAILLMVSLAAKPTFMQCLIPAAAAFFLIEWIRRPKNSRFFAQIIAAYVPACAYFLLQYLYYTGVLVPYSSGVVVGITPQSAWEAARNFALMAAFPLLALACCARKGLLRDKLLALTLWMTLFALLEAMLFHETGQRENHGNFTWASMSCAFLLWVVMLPKYLNEARACIAKRVFTLRAGGLAACGALLLWHAASGVYYIVYLLTSQNAF